MKKIEKVLIIFSLLCIAFIAAFLIWLRIALDNYSGKDLYHAFGDGRFYIISIDIQRNIRGLADNLDVFTLGDIQRYFQDDPYVYIEGYIADWYVKDENGKGRYSSTDAITGETTYYESKRETYRYVILNYETGEFQSYETLEEIPEEVRSFFEQTALPEECIEDRTCYSVYQ